MKNWVSDKMFSPGEVELEERLGRELLLNGGFDSWYGGVPDNWEIDGNNAGDPDVLQTYPGTCNFFSNGDAARLKQSVLKIGRKYRCRIEMGNKVYCEGRITNGGESVFYFNIAEAVLTTNVFEFVCSADNYFCIEWSTFGGGADFGFNSVSVKEILYI